ncbi:MAG: methyltransferase domain-containing protein [Rudaea sp.]
MTSADHFTGERYIPGVPGEIAYEHCHRYAFARRYARGRRVLDAACGEGYGSALLAQTAQSVVGVDIDAQVVGQARSRYAQAGNLRFETASVTELPLADASADLVVSFETIEHLEGDDQPAMLAEFARVLAPDGLLILSSPNRPEYSEARDYQNPFHRRELDRAELAALLASRFPAQWWFRQRRYLGSAIWREVDGERFEALAGSASRVMDATVPPAMYFVLIAARATQALPVTSECPALSLYADGDDAEWKRIDHEAREVLRLDALLRTRDEELGRQAKVLNDIIDERTRAQAMLLASLEDLRRTSATERERLLRQIDTQERIVAYRESVRWWLTLPMLRARRLWNRIRAA